MGQDDRLEALLAQMTLEEKVGQLGIFADMLRPFAPGINPEMNERDASQTLELICSLVVSTMLNAANDILDLPADQKQSEQELVDHFVLQLRLIFLGARLWREPG